MKMISLRVLWTVAAVFAGCTSGHQTSQSDSTGGIDPITMSGIEQSNAATEASNAATQAAIDQSNRAAADAATQAAANAQAAAAASANQ
jgi:hypothetical protein